MYSSKFPPGTYLLSWSPMINTEVLKNRAKGYAVTTLAYYVILM